MDVWKWMGDLVTTYGYVGAFVISIFGNLTIFFPVPFVLTIYAFGATLNPLFLGIVCGIGSMIGEFSAYLIGRGGRRIINNTYSDRLENAKLLVQRYGMTVIFLFAVLPLPDDLILIPLGMLKYDIRKAMIAMLAGKVIMCTMVAFAGKFSYTFVMDIFASSGIIGGIASVVLLLIIIVAMVRIDWTKFIDRKS